MRIYSNTAISIDGKIGTPQRGPAMFGSSQDHLLMSELRAAADAILIGGSILRATPEAAIETHSSRQQKLLNIVLTQSGNLPANAEFWQHPKTQAIIMCPMQTQLPLLPDLVKVHRLDQVSPSKIVHILETEYHVKNLLIETGGQILSQFIHQDLLHELYLTLCPLIIGGKHSPTLVDGDAFPEDALRKAKLLSSKRHGDELFLHYQMTSERVRIHA